jgi:hypothetical protein
MKITKLVPWLVKAAGTYWGEYFFVEVRTDEGVTGTAPLRASFANSTSFWSVKILLRSSGFGTRRFARSPTPVRAVRRPT